MTKQVKRTQDCWKRTDETETVNGRATAKAGPCLSIFTRPTLQGFAESTVLLLDLPRYISRELWTDKTGELSLAAAVAR